ncbi:RNA binding protein [Rhodotorula toruloides ATCC 204091]|nr:RNA binding protein [Rhodotorula toruloides ATCC 204091]
MGIKLQLSTAFHPETDGQSERTNKTVVQVLRQYVSRQQKDWTSHLSTVEYAINCAKNDSTGLSPFEVVLGFQPSSSPSGAKSPLPSVEWTLETREQRIKDARDTLAAAKVRQAAQANKKRGDEPTFSVGDLVMVDSSDRRSRYKTRSQDCRAAKLFARWDGPYEVVECFPDSSTYRLNLPFADRSHPVFHASKVKAYHPNNVDDFPAREPPRPEPMDVEGEEEYIVEAIVDEKGRGRSKKYLVKWRGYPESENTWEGAANVEDTEALDVWTKRKEGGEV